MVTPVVQDNVRRIGLDISDGFARGPGVLRRFHCIALLRVEWGAEVRRASPAHNSRNFPNRLGKNTQVFLGSAELAAVCSKLGRIPSLAEYQEAVGVVNQDSANVYKYMNFNEIEENASVADQS